MEQMTPVIIIAGTVFWTKRSKEEELAVADIFATLAIVSLVSSPISQLISCLPNDMASVACFDRIQEYLLEEEIYNSSCDLSLSQGNTGFGDTVNFSPAYPVELVEINVESSSFAMNPFAVIIKDGSVKSCDAENPIVNMIDLSIGRSICTMIVGPVGSGKTTLLNVILREKSLSKGSIQVECNQIAYCAQIPWLQNISIRDNIFGPNPNDDLWLATVIRACALEKDLSLLPNGDRTLVGSGGVALSGGQRHRIVCIFRTLNTSLAYADSKKALARAVYSRKPIMILDDVFGALDNTTASVIFERLLGKEGLLKLMGITVILATHSGKLLNSPL